MFLYRYRTDISENQSIVRERAATITRRYRCGRNVKGLPASPIAWDDLGRVA